MKKITFIMPNLGGGGGERIISLLLNNLDRNKYSPSLIILKKTGDNSFISYLKPDVEINYFDIKGRIRYSFIIVLLKLLKYCKKEKPNLLFFGSGQINATISPFLFLIPQKINCIARESNIPTLFEKNFIARILYRYTYKNFDKIIVQSDDMYSDLHDNFFIPSSRLYKINNPVDFDFIYSKLIENTDKKKEEESKIKLIAVGRLTYQKGFDLLIKELSQIKELNYSLEILGEGEDRGLLEGLIIQNQLEDKVHLLGTKENPYKYINSSDVFVLSSRFEGFPNVVLEALSLGIPVLANNCLGGINELIKPGFNGETFSFDDGNFKLKLDDIIKTEFSNEKIIDDTKTRFSIKNKMIDFETLLDDSK